MNCPFCLHTGILHRGFTRDGRRASRKLKPSAVRSSRPLPQPVARCRLLLLLRRFLLLLGDLVRDTYPPRFRVFGRVDPERDMIGHYGSTSYERRHSKRSFQIVYSTIRFRGIIWFQIRSG
jgi:hypothetical protein